MVKMLTDLGFSMKAISNIASQIDLESADAFGKYLTSLVGVVVGFNGLIKDLSMTPGQTFQSFTDAANTSTASTFSTGAGTLVTLAQQLSLYAGDAQIAKAQELVQLGQQFQQSQLAYLKQLYDLQQSISNSVAGSIRGMQLDLMTDDQKKSFYSSDIQKLMGQLGTATTATQVQDLFNQINADVSAAWGLDKTQSNETVLERLLNQAKSIADARISSFANDATSGNKALADAMQAAADIFTHLSTVIVPANSTATTTNTDAINAHTTATNNSTAATNAHTAAVNEGTWAMGQFVAAWKSGDFASAIAAVFRNDPSLLARGTGS
jgi:hypothetical protein